MPSHLASLERRACRWSGSAGSTSGLLAKWVQNGTVRRTALPTDNADTNTLRATSNRAHVSSFPFCCSTKIFIRHPRTLYATEDAFEKCKHELGERTSAVYYQCPVFASWMMIWFYALNLQRRGSRPNTKDTNKRVNSKSRKKPVSAATCDADETNVLVCCVSKRTITRPLFLSWHPQPLRLKPVGEECRPGRRERREPGL